MKQTINKEQFVRTFRDYGRFDQFGREALEILFDYFEELADDCGEEMELDVIAICCDYAVADAATIAQDYDLDVDGLDEDETNDVVTDYLNEHSTVIGVCDDGQIVYCTSF